MGADGYWGTDGGVETDRRTYQGVDRGFIFFENEPGVVWRGLQTIEDSEDGFRLESYYVDGRKIGQNHIAGNYAATVTSYDDPFRDIELQYAIFGFSYRENFIQNGEEHYRLHIVHNVSIVKNTTIRSTINATITPDNHTWNLVSIDSDLDDETFGSHLILDSSVIFPWVLRDIEAVLYGYPDTDAKIPTLDELYDIFALMNLVIIDHGDGTWSAVGHDVMVSMLDATEFEISSPTAEYVEDEPFTYEVESLIRDERWLE